MVHTLHDEIIVEARDAIEDQVEAIVKECMEEVFGGIMPEGQLWRRSEWIRVGINDRLTF